MLCCVFSTLDHSKRVLYIYTKMFLNRQLDQHLPFNYFKLNSCKSAPLYATNQSQHYQCVVTY